ncbi:hypothetical protein RvY_10164 [Ramazzottius varieornatus]|uniref:CHCH domain-containing protein n=1 Tax=Ramazzottius varieornatus TaxID=947166 RepID=A0A1D1VDZ3_RAMVA|nr:hypothetical protein RvY_10164 [Ramazzottius varieornatus]
MKIFCWRVTLYALLYGLCLCSWDSADPGIGLEWSSSVHTSGGSTMGSTVSSDREKQSRTTEGNPQVSPPSSTSNPLIKQVEALQLPKSLTDTDTEVDISRTDQDASYCRSYGKDKVIFLTKEDWDKPAVNLPESFIESLDEEERPRGVILPNGEINWGCPCLGNLSYGPCAIPFRQAFSCFHYSLADPKGSDCIDYFRDMTMCMANYPSLYPRDDKDDDEDDDDMDEEGGGGDPFSAIEKAEKQAQDEKRQATSRSSS